MNRYSDPGAEAGGRPVRVMRGAALALLVLGASAITGGAYQGAPQDQTAAPVLTEETHALYNGWALLAAGDAAKAAGYAQGVLSKYPRSIAAASLRIEAEIARGGGLAGLAAYEAWLGSRKLEDGYLLRRAARAILWQTTADPALGVEALQHLAGDDDSEALAQLVRRMVAGHLGDTRALARLGHQGAVNQLIKQIETGQGSKMVQIDALIQSKSPAAVPVLMKLLNDTNYQDHIAAAAEGLGTLNATQAIPELRRLYSDPKQLGSVRFSAAAGLFKLNDMTGVGMLQQRLGSDIAYLRIDTARRMAGNPDGAWQTAVRKALDDPDPLVRVTAAELLATHDRDLARNALEGLLLDDNPVIREKASQAMVQRIAGDFATLRRFLRAPDLAARVAAAGRVLELTR